MKHSKPKILFLSKIPKKIYSKFLPTKNASYIGDALSWYKKTFRIYPTVVVYEVKSLKVKQAVTMWNPKVKGPIGISERVQDGYWQKKRRRV